MTKSKKLVLFNSIYTNIKHYDLNIIESSIARYYLNSIKKQPKKLFSDYSEEIISILTQYEFPINIEYIIEFFEYLLDGDIKNTNGIVFTPKYISDYICTSLIEKKSYEPQNNIIDPSCGGGIFLVSAIEVLLDKYDMNVDEIIQNHIFGIDIEPNNVRRCKIVLRLISAKYGGNFEHINLNILCADSLKIRWDKAFNIDQFTYIIGNPPYVNPHDLEIETTKFLKNTFETTTTGVFNIYYAFIEHSYKQLSEEGEIGFIVPNNFLTISSAMPLRIFLKHNKCVYKIIDFTENMVFKPTRTYNCLLFINRKRNEKVFYSKILKTNSVKSKLKKIKFSSIKTQLLDNNSWKLIDETTIDNLIKIESQYYKLKPFIKTGIATLKDNVYFVCKDDNGYYKLINDNKFYIENTLVKPIYKIPELKLSKNISELDRYIIFPYQKTDSGYQIIDEETLQNNFPKTYNILKIHKHILDTRDNGKKNPKGWYAYGRSQGLNKYGHKLLFPTFSDKPRFILLNNEDALFCNGYAIFENTEIALEILEIFLNSTVMEYYIKNSSYPIEGGYYCYQKKYIEKFSVPNLNSSQIKLLLTLKGKKLESYIWKLYTLK